MTLLGIVLSIILIAVFWRLFAALALVALAVIVPLAVGLFAFVQTGSAVGGLVASLLALVALVKIIDEPI